VKTKIGVMGLTVAFAAVALSACSKAEDQADLAEWKGPSPHLHLTGTYQAEELNLQLPENEAGDIAKLACRREYQAPIVNGKFDMTKAKLFEVKLNGNVTVKGQARKLEIEFKRMSFTDGVGKSFAVIPRDDTASPGPQQMWFEWEWHDAATDDTLDERAAHEGSFFMGEMTGEVDANGVIPDNVGTFGGFVTAKWSETETVKLSFTAKCGENEVESDE
jgi:hypothetical protein